MTIPLNVDGAFLNEASLREMIAMRKVCFDHDPFYVMDGTGVMAQIGFQLNLYAGFQDPHHLPTGDDEEHREIVRDLQRLCRVFFQSLDLLKPCEYPDPPVPRVIYSPERRRRAEVCLQVPIFDRERFGAKPGRRLKELLATAECLLKAVGARPGKWEENEPRVPLSSEPCKAHVRAAEGADSEDDHS